MRRCRNHSVALVALMACLIFMMSAAERLLAANTVLWIEVDPPAPTGTFASQVCGDVNEDGHLDLVGGTLGLGIWIAAGDGDGTWTPLGAVTTSGTYYGLALGDVNNDGKLDIAGAEDGSGIHIWTGNGAGTWTAMASPSVSGKFASVALGDVNGDGKLDIAAGSSEGTGIKVWTGDGAGTWTAASAGLPGAGYATDLAFGDIDRDGRLDLVAASAGAGLRAWRGGGIWDEQSTGLPLTGNYLGVALGDLDHDGGLDLVAAGQTTGVSAWAAAGALYWSWTGMSTGLPATGDYWDVGLDDLNHNGDLDIAATSVGGGIQVWLGDGGGDWVEQSAELPTSGAFYRLSLGDFDEDGIPDLSAGHNAGARAWVDDGVPETLGGWLQIASPATTGLHLALDAGDWNHDGKLDVVAAVEEGGIQLWQGDGGNTWDEIADTTAPDLPDSGTYTGLAFGDLDHNGWLDVVAGSGEGAGLCTWLLMDETAWISACNELPPDGTFLDVDLGDFNNDGYLDIAAAGQNLGVRAWQAVDLDEGASGWWDRKDSGMPDTGTFLSVAYGDLDDDGKLDLVAGSENAGLGVWQGDGAGAWTEHEAPETSSTWTGIAVGDLNRDGHLDLVASSDTLGVQAWAGDGAFGWTALAAPAGSGHYVRPAVADVNNDGWLDVAAGWGKDGGLEVWAGNGGTAWTPFSINLPLAGIYPDVTLGEVDNDGVLDLIGARYGGGSVHVWAGAEGAPPGSWENFAPSEWISTSLTTDLSVQVLDAGSGLDPNSAEFATLETGVWSAWQHADCTGSEGDTTPQTVSAAAVTFSQDSGPYPHDRNQARFRIQDMAGNLGYSDPYIVYLDTTPPTNPTTFTSSHWPAGAWENDTTVDVEWDGAADETSGVSRYSYVFSTFCDLPDTIVDLEATDRRVTSPELADGEWYIAVRTRDVAGVWAPDAACDGPYRIDTGPPTNPTAFSSTPPRQAWANANTVDINWSGAEDGGSGVYGYTTAWLRIPDYTMPTPSSVDTTDTFERSPVLDDGNDWYFHLRTRDRAGNWSWATAHWGPYYIDTALPYSCSISTPGQTTSDSFLVEWSYVDDTSGIASYDVQVRDGASGTWTNQWMGTTATSETYTGAQHLHTYYFRVRARDHAGNITAYICQDSTSVVEDLVPTGLEVTQVIQNLANDVPLVEDKRTYVRFYVRSSWTDVPLVDAELHGTRGGLALPGSPLAPSGGLITVQPGGGDRAVLDDSFYFALPPEWRSGTVTLRAVVNPDHTILESSYLNNERTETVSFEPGCDLCLMMVPVHLHPDTYDDGDAGYDDILRLLGVYYPVPEDGIEDHQGRTMTAAFHESGREYNLPDDYNWVLSDLWCYAFWTWDRPCSDMHFFGMVHPNSQPTGSAGMGYRPGHQAAGVMAITRGGARPEPVGGRVMAHELGHNLGRQHVLCTGCEPDGGEVDSSYPYPGPLTPPCQDPPLPYTCRIGPDDPAAFYGFWPDGSGGPEIFPPLGTADLMSYGTPRWISDWTYDELGQGTCPIFGGASVAPAQKDRFELPAAWAEADDYLFAAGIVSLSEAKAELRSFYRLADPNPEFVTRSIQQELEDGIYRLILEDAQGQALYTHTFTATAMSDGASTPDQVAFAEVLPYDARTARIVLADSEAELASRAVSAHAPVVTLLTPNGGEVFDETMLISWTGSDADGDDLLYTIQYSRDDGQTWRSVAIDLAGTSLTVGVEDLSTLPGSNQARVRVIGSDGVNTGEDQSDGVFTLARRPPSARIVEPVSGSHFGLGSTVVLSGRGMDVEDGALEDAALTWASDLGGDLGSGWEVWANNLAAGVHHITLTATDSDGDVGTDTVTIYVSVSTNRVYLPVILKSSE